MAVYVALAGAVIAAYSQYQGGQNAKDIANQNRLALDQTAQDNQIIAIENMAIAEREAIALEEKGLAATAMKRKEISRLLAYQRTQEAVSGFRYEGTPELVAAESFKEGELDVATIWSNALTESELTRAKGRVVGLQGNRIAGQLRTQGDIMALSGEYAASAGSYGGAATLLQGVSSAYNSSMKIG
ncbi:MAG: hypothetical protein IMZ61_11630 [Planctomycetes bacterium]|nr:hypothetical protein [Planctomycetota bacterium]